MYCKYASYAIHIFLLCRLTRNPMIWIRHMHLFLGPLAWLRRSAVRKITEVSLADHNLLIIKSNDRVLLTTLIIYIIMQRVFLGGYSELVILHNYIILNMFRNLSKLLVAGSTKELQYKNWYILCNNEFLTQKYCFLPIRLHPPPPVWTRTKCKRILPYMLRQVLKGTVARDFRPLVFFMNGPNKDP